MHLRYESNKRVGAPAEIDGAFVFLAETPHITGQTIAIDGGWQKKISENNPKRNV